MPRYEFKCENDHRQEAYVTVDERNNPLECRECTRPMRRVYHTPGMSMDGRAFRADGFDVNDWLASQ